MCSTVVVDFILLAGLQCPGSWSNITLDAPVRVFLDGIYISLGGLGAKQIFSLV